MLKTIYEKHKEMILYLFFGGLTTLVNIVVYWIFVNLLHVDYLVSNMVAWLLSVLFAYITNKTYVFQSKSIGFLPIMREFSAFVSCRLFSGLIDMGIMYLGISIFGFYDLLIKILSNVIVVILNYVFSKLFIFRKNK